MRCSAPRENSSWRVDPLGRDQPACSAQWGQFFCFCRSPPTTPSLGRVPFAQDERCGPAERYATRPPVLLVPPERHRSRYARSTVCFTRLPAWSPTVARNPMYSVPEPAAGTVAVKVVASPTTVRSCHVGGTLVKSNFQGDLLDPGSDAVSPFDATRRTPWRSARPAMSTAPAAAGGQGGEGLREAVLPQHAGPAQPRDSLAAGGPGRGRQPGGRRRR
jgi:hypothetical protein